MASLRPPWGATTRPLLSAARFAIALLAAGALLTGALNIRSAFGGPDLLADPAAPSALAPVVGGQSTRAPSPLDAQIAELQAALRDDSRIGDPRASILLGRAYLQKARETADPSWYPKAQTLLLQGLAADPADPSALVGLGTLELARHNFADALSWGEKAVAAAPGHAPAYGVVADAQVELGRYDDAARTVQQMVDLRPDLASYARVSYIRELMGDRPGSLAAMEQAASAGSGFPENVAWVYVQLGGVSFGGDDLDGAAGAYAKALAALPDYVPALAGQARVLAARGDLAGAAVTYETVVERLPLPEYLIAYGETLDALGRPDEAKDQYALVRAIQAIYTANGVDGDLELARFVADYGGEAELPEAVALARAAVAKRPSIFAFEVLAWTLYRTGDLDGANAAIRQALRLGTRDATLHFRAGMIAAARGDRAAAIDHLDQTLAINPSFSLRYGPVTRSELNRLRAMEVTE